MSHKFRSERTKVECWCGFRADARVKLGEKGGQVGSSPGKTAHWAQIDILGLRVERVRDFGRVYLALALWRRLGLHQLLKELFKPGKEQVQWELIACILVIARICGNKSELEVAQRWYADSALEDLLGVVSNRDAIGARVEIQFAGQRRFDQVVSGSGFLSQNSRELHFGLGTAETVDRVLVIWPSGVRTELSDLESNRVHVAQEESR